MGIRVSRVLFGGLVFLSAASSFTQDVSSRPLITLPLNDSQLVRLKGNTHPLAQPQFDMGIADPSLQLDRMLLVLKRSPEQEFALQKLLDAQQDKASPDYRRWLTPDQFGAQFGPSDQDMQLITGWLRTHGFQVNRVSQGRAVIEFSGNEGQLESAFHTQIHKYLVNGEEHWANASDPEIPAALAPAVAGVLSLHNFPRKPMSQVMGTYSPRTRQLSRATPRASAANPQFTLFYGCYPNGTCYAVGPADFGAIYNVQSLWDSGIDGTGQTIAIVGESDINIQDVRDFRSAFGLPAKDPQIIYDGPNPGPREDESEADIDVQWSGAIAPNADIDFVVSESTETSFGVDLSALYIIDHNLAPVMSESYGACELAIGTAGNKFYNSLWAQAAAQGITAILSSGDSGSALCDFPGGPAQFGLAVSGFASTPNNVAIGGTDFNDFLHETQYWNATNTSPTQESAKGYIPETTWNDSCTNSIFLKAFGFGQNAENDCNNPQIGGDLTIGGSGGVSKCTTNDGQSPSSCSGGYAKPSWQVAPGVPSDGKRDLPDISLFASNGILNSFYIFCESDAAFNCGIGLYGAAGGTSFGAPAFAGIMALINQKMQQLNLPQRQGNANYVMYKLAGQQTASACNSSTGPGANCVFNDVTSGTIAMACVSGSPNCTVKTSGHRFGILSGYNTAIGYDLATGLGSINVGNLVSKWNSVTFRSTDTHLALSPTTNLTHGQSITVGVQVTPSSGSGTPTGDVSLLTSTGIGVAGFTLSGGSISGNTNLLPGGNYTVTAHYAGDSTFGGSDSAPVSLTIGKEDSSPQIQLVTFDSQGNLISRNANSAIYGSPYLLRIDVLNGAGTACQTNNVPKSGCPTGSLALTDNGIALDAGTYSLNSLGYTEDQVIQLPGGSNAVKAQYAGDASFNPSSATANYSITPAPTSIAIPSIIFAQAGAQFSTNTSIQSQSTGAGPTGTVTFLANGAPINGTPTYSSSSGANSGTATLTAGFTSSSTPFAVPGTYSITAQYSGDQNYAGSTSAAKSVTVKYAMPDVSLTPFSPSVNSGNNLTITGLVHGFSTSAAAPTGTIQFLGNSVALSGTVNYQTVVDSTGRPSLQGSLTFAPLNNEIINASYSGDSNYPQATGFGGGVTVFGSDFGMYAQPASIAVGRGQQNGLQVFVAGETAYNGTINFTAASCSGLPAESTCNFSPATINGTGWTELTITTTSPHQLARQNGQRPWTPLLATTAFGLIGILSFSGVRQRHGSSVRTLLAMLVMLLCASCGGGSSVSNPPPKVDPGTPKGTYVVTVSGTSGTLTHSASFSLTVQ